eukprot:2620-Heterococcus_DN1.PRE.5
MVSYSDLNARVTECPFGQLTLQLSHHPVPVDGRVSQYSMYSTCMPVIACCPASQPTFAQTEH